MFEILYDIVSFIAWYILPLYGVALASVYLFLAGVSYRETKRYMRSNSFINNEVVLGSPLSPGISLLAPAFNEALNIVENVKSLLKVHYVDFEVIIINDGSSDDTLERLAQHFHLQIIPDTFDYPIPTAEIRGVYRSQKPEYHNLIVIDKENGGKADALNAGINISSKPYTSCIDVDCILEQDALTRMVKPFLTSSEDEVVAAGGVIRIANSCKIFDGKISEVRLPKNLLARFQALEYIRSFLLGRMAWSRLNGLLIISGAFGMFKRQLLIEIGGYDTTTVGEDMEIVVRLRRYMHKLKRPYKVAYIPDPLCWTEVPENVEDFLKQRRRWTRGNFETLKRHRGMLFNPKYKLLGLLSYPFWVLFEWLAPLIEVVGWLVFWYHIGFGLMDNDFFLILLCSVYFFSVFFSLLAILLEENTFHQYRRRGELTKLIGMIFLELFIFHPLVTFGGLWGNFDLLFRKKGWMKIERKGFTNETATIP